MPRWTMPLCGLLCCAALLGSAPRIAHAHRAHDADQELSLMQVANGNTLYVVGYAHLDTQWRWTYPEVIRDFIPNTLHGNFRLIEKYPNYIFNFSGSRRYRMMEEYYPQAFEQLKGYVAAGRWFPCGSSVDECDACVPSTESFIRQVLYGNHYFRTQFGKDSAEFMLPDCFGFPAHIPGTLSHCGLKGFSTQKLSWGSANGLPFNVGVWEGLDGTSIIVAALNPGAYVGKVEENLAHSEKWDKRIAENGAQSGVFKDYHYFGTGDTGGPPEEQSVAFIQQSAEDNTGQVRVVSGTAEQMFLDLTDEQIARLPRYKGDLLLTEHSAGSITSQAYMKRLNRQGELLADAAEKSAVAARLLGGPAYPRTKLNNAWELLLGGQMHDILPGTSHPKGYEYSWNDNILALNQFADVLETSTAAIASGLDTDVAGVPIVVYNPLGWEREELVEAEVRLASTPDGNDLIVTDPNGLQSFGTILSRTNDTARILFRAKVAPCSFSTYSAQLLSAGEQHGESNEPSAGEENGTYYLSNDRYSIVFGAEGDVASIYDKLTCEELLAAPHRLAFVEDSPGYWPAWNIDWDDQQSAPKFVDGPATIRVVEDGPLRATIEVTREARGSKFVQRISLSAGDAGERVEFHNVIDWRSKSCNLKAVFPLTAGDPQATYNWGVGTIRRGNNDAKKYEVPAHQWFDLTNARSGFGATVLCPMKYGSDKPDDNTLRLTLLRTPGPILTKEGAVNFDYADQCSQDWGRHEISYAIAGHAGSWQNSGTDRMAYEFEQPLIAFQAEKHPGALGRELSLAEVDSPNVRIMALKQAEDSSEVIVRFVEMHGDEEATPVRFRCALPIATAREVNGQEQAVGPATVDNGELVFDIGGYKLRSFALSFGKVAAQIAAPQSQPVALPYNTSVSTRDGEMATGGFDGMGRCLADEMLPESFADGGVAFQLAPGGAGVENAVSCNGQSIALPAGEWNRVYLLAASSPSDQAANFMVDDKLRSLTIQDWGGFIGQWDNRTWEGEIPETAFKWPYPLLQLKPAYVKRAPVAWFASHRHNADGRNDIYEYSYIYRYALDVPAGAQSVTLPVNDKIKVLALTVAQDSAAALRPAQPLYDTLKGHPAADFGGWLPQAPGK